MQNKFVLLSIKWTFLKISVNINFIKEDIFKKPFYHKANDNHIHRLNNLYKVSNDGTVREIIEVNRGNWGGTSADGEYLDFLKCFIGDSDTQSIQQNEKMFSLKLADISKMLKKNRARNRREV